jgi:hypothetical protein
MAKEEYLTNERLKGKFNNNFDLANYAIDLAGSYMERGETHGLKQIMDELVDVVNSKEEDNENKG